MKHTEFSNCLRVDVTIHLVYSTMSVIIQSDNSESLSVQ